MKRYKRKFEKYSNLDFENLDSLVSMIENVTCWHDGWKIYEAVINPKVEVNVIKNIIIKNQNNFYKNVNSIDNFKQFFNNLFENRKITIEYFLKEGEKFVLSSRYSHGVNEIIISAGKLINILFEDKNNKDYLRFAEELSSSIGHELVHRYQAIKIEYEEKRIEVWDSISDRRRYYDLKKKRNISNEERYINYLATPQEVMVHAWKIINNFRLCGFNDNQIVKMISSNFNSDIVIKSGGIILQDYYNIFKPLEKTNKYNTIFRTLCKYMYQYLDL